MWLHDISLSPQGLVKARVLTYGYDATAFIKPFDKSSNGRTLTFAEGLLNDLADQRTASWVGSREYPRKTYTDSHKAEKEAHFLRRPFNGWPCDQGGTRALGYSLT